MTFLFCKMNSKEIALMIVITVTMLMNVTKQNRREKSGMSEREIQTAEEYASYLKAKSRMGEAVYIDDAQIQLIRQCLSENAILKSRLEAAERERYAALKDIHKYCGTCVRGVARIDGDEQPTECVSIHGCGNKNWQWRGAQVDGGGSNVETSVSKKLLGL